MNAITLLKQASQDQVAGPTIAFYTSVAATFAGMALTGPSTLSTAPTSLEALMWTLAGINAGLLASLALLHHALNARQTLTQ